MFHSCVRLPETEGRPKSLGRAPHPFIGIISTMNWLRANWRYFALFGGLLLPVLSVAMFAKLTGGDGAHIWFREAVIHMPWGFCLTALFVILMMTYQNQRDTVIGWKWRYIIPFAAVMACAAIQEFGFSMTELFAGRWSTVIGETGTVLSAREPL